MAGLISLMLMLTRQNQKFQILRRHLLSFKKRQFIMEIDKNNFFNGTAGFVCVYSR
jgi:hypothetical protein